MLIISKIYLVSIAFITYYVARVRASHQIRSAERQDLRLLSGARVLSPPQRAAVAHRLQHHRPAARHPRVLPPPRRAAAPPLLQHPRPPPPPPRAHRPSPKGPGFPPRRPGSTRSGEEL